MSAKIKKILWIIGVIIVVLGVLVGVGYLTLIPKPLKPPETISSLAELESYLEELTGHNPDSPAGLSLVVVKDGEIAYQRGFGLADGPKNISTTADTVYNTWSMVKPMSAVAVLQLHEQRRVGLRCRNMEFQRQPGHVRRSDDLDAVLCAG